MKFYKVKRWYYRCRKWIRRIAHLFFFFSCLSIFAVSSFAAKIHNYESFYKLMGDDGYIYCTARDINGIDYFAGSYQGTNVVDFDIDNPYPATLSVYGLSFRCMNAPNINQKFSTGDGLYISHCISICSGLNYLTNVNKDSFTFRVGYIDSQGYTDYISVPGDDIITTYKLDRTSYDRLTFNLEAVIPLPDGTDNQISTIEYYFDDIGSPSNHFDIYPQYGNKVYYTVAPIDELPQYMPVDSQIHDDYAAAEEEILSQYDPNSGVNSIVNNATDALEDLSAPITVAGAIIGRFLDIKWVSNVITISLCCGVVLLLLGLVGRVISTARKE